MFFNNDIVRYAPDDINFNIIRQNKLPLSCSR